jgi:hypothetical protein
MRITYKPQFGTRIIEEMGVDMNASNSWTQGIDGQENILALLTYPNGTFIPAIDEPVAQIVGAGNVAALVDLGITTATELAAGSDKAEEIAARVGASLETVHAWVEQAARVNTSEE